MKTMLTFSVAALCACFGFTSCNKKSGTAGGEKKVEIRAKGSDTMIQLATAWAEAYRKVKPNVFVNANGGGTGTGGPSLELNRGSGAGSAPAIASVGLPDRSSASAPASGGDAGARRTVAGALLVGPIANRPVLNWISPVYPEWAKRDAVEGSVTLYFVVRPDGSVLSKKEVLRDLQEGGLKFTSIEIANVNVRIYGQTALLTGARRP